ncbi:MAG: alpha/beta hydrolase [Deltaproteobacteria bacterium]|nr:alpha/beta hydrolase [Deltaproteobacteria bacterium]MBW2416446.1 alpha/beta hydrolase [Deltaproteobacteria bacterium]
MKTLRFLATVIAGAFSVVLRRLFRGALRPTWTLRTELLRMSVRATLMGSVRFGVPWLRSLPSPARPDPHTRLDDVDAGGVPARWCVPTGADADDRVVLYLHGGGYVFGSPRTHADIIARLAAQVPARVLAVEYRLGPEFPFPAAHDDCLAAYRWLVAQGTDPSRIVLAGDSAGGGLCTGTLLSLREAREPQPAGALLISPWVDPLADGGTIRSNEPFDVGTRDFLVNCIGLYLEGKPPDDARVAPLGADLRGLAPLFIGVGRCEMLLDQARALDARARDHGVKTQLSEYEDQFHVFQNLAAFIPEADRAVDEMVGWVRSRLG